jgi:fructokinase
MTRDLLYGGIEAGGTKFICAVADEDLNIIDQVRIDTTVPEETMGELKAFFDQYKVESFGISSFGPIDINHDSPTYGYITSTPKLPWQNYDFVGQMKTWFGDKPIAWTTDVNGASLAENTMGAAKGAKSCLYLTIGTGVGGGFSMNGEIYHAYAHPEMGHIKVAQDPHDHFEGACPFHGNCIEGLVSGPAIEKRTGIKGADLPSDHEVWDYVADYLGQAIANYTLTLAPERVVLGGGVMHQDQLLDKIRLQVEKALANYA